MESKEFYEMLNRLTGQVALLKERVAELSERVTILENGQYPIREMAPLPGDYDILPADGVLNWADREALLPRIATVCFLLVIALILRTITDNGMVNTQVGSLLGLGYASTLILVGWRLFSGGHRLAPVFPLCGVLLLFSIILEVHARFEALPVVVAYLFLFAQSAVVAVIAFRYQAGSLLSVGLLGAAILGMSLDFPYPVYPLAGLLILVASIIAARAAQYGISPSLRWTTLLLTMFYWLIWGIKVEAMLGRGEQLVTGLYGPWYFPMLLLFVVVHLAIAFWLSVNREEPLGIYEGLLPTVNGVWAYLACWPVAMAWGGRQQLIAAGVTALGLGHIVLAELLARRDPNEAPGANAFSLAGVVLLALGLPFVTGSVFWALPLWSLLACVLILLSSRWQSGGARVTSYAFQFFACGMAIFTGAFAVGRISPAVGITAAGGLAVLALLQYRWARTHEPPRSDSGFFSWLDKGDVSAVILLVTGLISLFAAGRLGMHAILRHVLAEPDNLFRGGQTILINSGAVLLLVLSMRKRSVELLVVAVAVGLFGALKVFFYDMFRCSGIPLVLGVFSFGIVAAVGSMVSSRWRQPEAQLGTREAETV